MGELGLKANMSRDAALKAMAALRSVYAYNGEAFRKIFRAEEAASLPIEHATPLLNAGLIKKSRDGMFESDFRVSNVCDNFIVTDRFTSDRYGRVYPVYPDESDIFAKNIQVNKGDKVLDMFTGSGVQAVICASKGAQVTAADINPRALAFTKFNAQLNGVEHNMRIIKSDLFKNLPNAKYDAIIANPPFIAVPDNNAWFRHGSAGIDGLRLIDRFMPEAVKRLSSNGKIWMVTNSFVNEDGDIQVLKSFSKAFDSKASLAVKQVFSPSVAPLLSYTNVFWGAKNHAKWVKTLEDRRLTGVCRLIITAQNAAEWRVEELKSGQISFDAIEVYGRKPLMLKSQVVAGGWDEMLSRYAPVNAKNGRVSSPFILPVETKDGKWDFECRIFESKTKGKRNGINETYLVLKKDWKGNDAPYVSVRSLCTFGDMFHSGRCNCGPQLDAAIELVGSEGGVIVVAMHQDGRGISLVDHANAYSLQEKGLDTVQSYQALGLPVDRRSYKGAAKILRQWFGLKKITLITNNPEKIETCRKAGIVTIPFYALIPAEDLNTARARQFIAAYDKMHHRFPDGYLQKIKSKL